MEKQREKFNYVSFLWNIAESLRGTYKAEDYGKVMLPLIVLRRFDCLLDEQDREVIKKVHSEIDYVKGQEKDEIVIAEVEEIYNEKNIHFFNTSDYSFNSLIDDSDGIEANLKAYINGFSENVKKIMEYFKFTTHINHLNKKNKLYAVIKKFSEVDLHMNQVSNEEMGNIYEEMIRRFYENTDAGEHYTPREVVELCMEMLFYTKEEFIQKQGKLIDIADFCVGTGGMLSEAKRYIEERNQNAEIQLYGQELMDESFAICQADMIMKGESPENIRLGDTLSDDKFKGEKFRFLISNPPYGVTWKDEENKIKEENLKGFDGRFGAGIPRTSDGSLLFLQNMISKMKNDKEGSRIAIILNGSPLFTGGAGSGESDIRKWIIESDILEGLIALPTDMFYNTGISTYIWILTNKKIPERKGKIQLVDGSKYYEKMRKSLGKKRNKVTKEQIREIKAVYSKFEETDISKIFDNEDFGFRKITIERPLKLKFEITEKTLENFINTKQYINLSTSKKKNNELKHKEELEGKENQKKIIEALNTIKGIFMDREEFLEKLRFIIKTEGLNFVKSGMIKAIWSSIGVRDENAIPCKNNKGEVEADPTLRDTEVVPLKENVREYFDREVLKHFPDAFIDESTLDKIGYEIPFTKHFYKFSKLKPFGEIMEEIKLLEKEIQEEIKKVLN